MTEKYLITEKQWSQVNEALLAAISICAVHVPEMQDKMLKASFVMDDIIDADEALDDDEPEAAA